MSLSGHHTRHFNLPPGASLADLDPVEVDEEMERIFEREDQRWQRNRDDEQFNGRNDHKTKT